MAGMLILIRNLEHLQEIANEMKQEAMIIADDDPKHYSKTESEAWTRSNHPDVQEHINEMSGRRAIYFNSRIINLVLTKSDTTRTWHLSCSEVPYKDNGDGTIDIVVGPNSPPTIPNADTIKIILDTFFDEWESIPNPTKLSFVSHYVGD